MKVLEQILVSLIGKKQQITVFNTFLYAHIMWKFVILLDRAN
jgi:hypothetical protein